MKTVKFVILMFSAMVLPALALARTNDSAVWSVAGKQVLRMRGAVNGMSPLKRVEELDERLNEILSIGEGKLVAENIVIHRDKGEVSIVVRGMLLVTVAAVDATANHTTKEGLAKVWLSNLRNTLPLLAPRENKHGA